jgi:hypothetical protein
MREKSRIPDPARVPGGASLLHDTPDVLPVRRDWMARAVLIMALALLAMATFGVWLRFRPIPYDISRWQEAGGFDRGRMLHSLLKQTGFVGFTRTNVEKYLGAPNLNERQFWYDLGPAESELAPEPRAAVGDPKHLYGVFAYDLDGIISDVLYSRRRPILGSQPFDSSGWFGGDATKRRTMFTRALGRLRSVGLTQSHVAALLGPPDGTRNRAHYDVGMGGSFLGSAKALVIDYDPSDVVTATAVVE